MRHRRQSTLETTLITAWVLTFVFRLKGSKNVSPDSTPNSNGMGVLSFPELSFYPRSLGAEVISKCDNRRGSQFGPFGSKKKQVEDF